MRSVDYPAVWEIIGMLIVYKQRVISEIGGGFIAGS